jgi:hypothetical protein
MYEAAANRARDDAHPRRRRLSWIKAKLDARYHPARGRCSPPGTDYRGGGRPVRR